MENVEYELLFQDSSKSIDTLFDVYRNNPYNARVIYMNNNANSYVTHRLVVFKDKKNFNIVLFRKKFGISKTNRMYNREVRVSNISYKNNKFYLIYNKQVRPLTIHNLRTAFINCSDHVINYLIKEFSWIKFIIEKDILSNIAFNTIISKKIYSYKKAIQHTYSLPYNVGKKLDELMQTKSSRNISKNTFKKSIEYLDNITSLDFELIKNNFSLFDDTLRMAKMLNEKINCKWKLKRLKEVHDEWSERITDITFIDADRKMSINNIFIKFAEFTNFKLLTTTKEMCLEGKKNNHCVATYVSKVEYGQCGIYHIDGYTLEITKDYYKNGLSMSQFRGYRNEEAPTELKNMVKEHVDSFNDKYTESISNGFNDIIESQAFDLPF